MSNRISDEISEDMIPKNNFDKELENYEEGEIRAELKQKIEDGDVTVHEANIEIMTCNFINEFRAMQGPSKAEQILPAEKLDDLDADDEVQSFDFEDSQ